MKSSRKSVFNALRPWAMILAGNAILAFIVAAFVEPHGIIVAGTTGIALALNRVFSADTALAVLILNILMLLLGLIVLGKKFFLTTVASSLLFPMFLAVIQRVPGLGSLTSNPLLASLFAGGLLGAAVGMVMRVGSSTGGTDVVKLVMHKWLHWPLSVCVWATDIVVLGVQALFSDTEQILFLQPLKLQTSPRGIRRFILLHKAVHGMVCRCKGGDPTMQDYMKVLHLRFKDSSRRSQKLEREG